MAILNTASAIADTTAYTADRDATAAELRRIARVPRANRAAIARARGGSGGGG